MNHAAIERVTGPLAPLAGELAEHLERRGYGEAGVGERLRRLGLLSEWMRRRRLEPADLDESTVVAMLAALYRPGRSADIGAGVVRSGVGLAAGAGCGAARRS